MRPWPSPAFSGAPRSTSSWTGRRAGPSRWKFLNGVLCLLLPVGTGRKRHLLVDAAGLVLLAHVHAADLQDRLGAQALVAGAGPDGLPRLEPIWDDQACTGTFARWLAEVRG